MSTNTNNYKLIKPAQEDFYNVDDFNNNADIIDSQLKAISDKASAALPATSYTAADILNKLKTVDGANSGLDADLFKGESIIPIANGGTGATSNSIAIRNLGNPSYVFLTRSPDLDEGVNRSDINSLVMAGVLLTEAVEGVKNIPSFFRDGGRKTAVCFDTGNPAQYNGYMAFDYYSKEIAMRMGQAQDWRRIVTDNNIVEMVQSALQSGGVSVVKSIQRGSVAIHADMNSNTATISAVNINKAIVLYTGMSTSNNSLTYYPSITLTSPTEITATRYAGSGNYSTVIPYQVIEFY